MVVSGEKSDTISVSASTSPASDSGRCKKCPRQRLELGGDPRRPPPPRDAPARRPRRRDRIPFGPGGRSAFLGGTRGATYHAPQRLRDEALRGPRCEGPLRGHSDLWAHGRDVKRRGTRECHAASFASSHVRADRCGVVDGIWRVRPERIDRRHGADDPHSGWRLPDRERSMQSVGFAQPRRGPG